MIWKTLRATFGTLEQRSLELGAGLNLIDAPNESGKSTWCTFLRTMLYGCPPRSRGVLADKNRYLPWSGSPMEGSIDLDSGGQCITISRRTARANSPMGAFSAVYTGTATPVEGLTGSACGEMLLGVPREVFERSAFIRQAGLAIDQDAELERRIAALITTGEEDTSFSAAYDRLKKQLNARRYNKSGQIPHLEEKIGRLETALRQARSLQQQAAEGQAALPHLEAQEGQLSRALESAAAASARREAQKVQAQTRQAWLQAKGEWERQQQETRRLADRAAALPSRERLMELRSAAGNITVSQVSRAQLTQQLVQRRQAEETARQALAACPVFQGRTGTEAQAQAQRDSAAWQTAAKRSRLRLPLFFASFLCLGLCALSVLLWHTVPAGALAAFGAAVCLVGALLCLRERVRAAAIAEPYAAGTAEDFDTLARRYTALYEVWLARRREAEDTARRLEELTDSIAQAQARLLEAVRPFAPAADELPAVVQAVDGALELLRSLDDARALEGRLEARCEALSAALPPETDACGPTADIPVPDVPALRSQLGALRRQLAEARQSVAACQGQLRSLGDAAELQEQLEEAQSRREWLQGEYDALALAMEALSRANTDLQNRFSPALGEKAANIFTKLTGGKYNKVLLNRELDASAQEAGDTAPREALLLSQGTADQLYLAVRLAICEMVLPAEKAVPLVLDDALTSFDDARCAAALDVLMELSRTRQILLFTCQGREGAYLRRAYPGAFTDIALDQ